MPRTLILFGAFDRHNFGDLLFPHIAAALLPGRALIHAGLAVRDLRPYGGHAVRALHEVRATLGAQPADLLHVGGEILTCSAWQAAVMLLPAQETQTTVAYLERHPQEQQAWVPQFLGLEELAPYVADRSNWPGLRRMLCAGVGGVAWVSSDAALRAEVRDKLHLADQVTVRDEVTRHALQSSGVAVSLLPDPVVLVADVFAARLQQHADRGEVAHLRKRFPQGYLAVQCSAEFGDDATLATLGSQLREVVDQTGWGLALFRAGAAPWHDSLPVLQRLAAQLEAGTVQVFDSLDIWDISALICASRGYAGSSLHGRIVALAGALPRVSLRSPAAGTQQGKTAAWVRTWEGGEIDTVVEPAQLARALQHALAIPAAARQVLARDLVQRSREGFFRLRALLDD